MPSFHLIYGFNRGEVKKFVQKFGQKWENVWMIDSLSQFFQNNSIYVT